MTGRYVDRNHAKEVYKYHRQVLIPRFGLRAPNIDGKPVVNADEVRVLSTHNIAYDTSIFPSERQRLHQAGCYLILSYTGARIAELIHNQRRKPKDGSIEELFGLKVVPSEVRPGNDGSDDEGESEEVDVAPDEDSLRLDELLCTQTIGRGRPKALCYEDISMMIVEHPVTRRLIPAMSIKFVHHKGSDNKPKPTIFSFTPTKKLIFCAVSIIIALALHDHAFDAPSLTDATRVLETKNWGPTKSTQLRWKESMKKIPVFRRFGRGGVLSKTEAMQYSQFRDALARQSLDMGSEKSWTSKFFRRGASNAVNGNAPDVVRDQMMRHDPRFAMFHGAYLNERVNFDLQNTFLEEETEDQLYRLFAHVSLTRDPRAKRDMVPPEVWADLPPDPEIVALEQQRAALKGRNYRIRGQEHEAEIRQLTERIRTLVAQREAKIVVQYRQHYFYNRSTWNIESQARGEEEEEYAEPAITLDIPERARLAEIWCKQPSDLNDDEIDQLRIEAIDTMVALCDKRETVKRNRIRDRAQTDIPIKQETPEPDAFPLLMDPAQCPSCIGDERLPCDQRRFKYCRPVVRNDHFDDQHLEERERAEQRGEPIRCDHPKCKNEKFQHLDHFRSHVHSVHGVPLRSSEQVEMRRRKKVRHQQMVSTKRRKQL
ncbi:hypothetical protein ACHAQF_009103 [Verticillium nonalfalfae]|uniref:FluG domain-containing protein n=1 Tax=Verticillium dahliae TaxID=27337 RepID=A0A2J8CH32_VERDA|nr:FluG domain-containing protein [Verticillium dahliae]PNH36297.1 hypothetical protein BJF96_g577 [Verticillium dahliae]PNH48833.1 hypothetical protein VD0003_g8295 [Verticillium dahliae]PNH60274.1 hypothetical protein VD0002_g7345 [Verticillium dahliae]RXG41451.1 hypothetical protein VDGE_05257 [Verticillium dahliae]